MLICVLQKECHQYELSMYLKQHRLQVAGGMTSDDDDDDAVFVAQRRTYDAAFEPGNPPALGKPRRESASHVEQILGATETTVGMGGLLFEITW